MRELPRHMLEYFEIAKKLNLSFPLGRAFYACSRIQQEGGGWLNGMPTTRVEKATYRMVHAKDYTAQYWQGHFENGGSVKSIKMSQAAYNERRRNR